MGAPYAYTLRQTKFSPACQVDLTGFVEERSPLDLENGLDSIAPSRAGSRFNCHSAKQLAGLKLLI